MVEKKKKKKKGKNEDSIQELLTDVERNKKDGALFVVSGCTREINQFNQRFSNSLQLGLRLATVDLGRHPC